jgi:hypothetical protein
MAAEFEIQKALFTALSGLGLTVVDSASQRADGGSDTGFPYVEVGYIALADFDTRGETGFDYTARIHTHSRSSSMKQCKDLQGQVYERLHNGALSVAGHNHILIRRVLSDVTRVADGSFHGVCEYRGLIEKA